MESLDLVDWNKAYQELLEYKKAKGVQQPGDPVQLSCVPYWKPSTQSTRLQAEESVVQPKSHDDRQRLQEVVTSILRGYADRLYRRRQAPLGIQEFGLS